MHIDIFNISMGMHCKVEKIGVEPMSISPDNP